MSYKLNFQVNRLINIFQAALSEDIDIERQYIVAEWKKHGGVANALMYYSYTVDVIVLCCIVHFYDYLFSVTKNKYFQAA
ncbi:hypothetical protein ACKLNO_04205 [Neisseriaceae bacterium B1]